MTALYLIHYQKLPHWLASHPQATLEAATHNTILILTAFGWFVFLHSYSFTKLTLQTSRFLLFSLLLLGGSLIPWGWGWFLSAIFYGGRTSVTLASRSVRSVFTAGSLIISFTSFWLSLPVFRGFVVFASPLDSTFPIVKRTFTGEPRI
jgi:hypothetical protein